MKRTTAVRSACWLISWVTRYQAQPPMDSGTGKNSGRSADFALRSEAKLKPLRQFHTHQTMRDVYIVTTIWNCYLLFLLTLSVAVPDVNSL